MSARRYLLWCVNEHIEFRVPELVSVAKLFKIPFKWLEKPKEDPFLFLEFQNEVDAIKVISRCMLVRAGYEVWGEGHSRDGLHNDIKHQCSSLINHHIDKNNSFRIRVETYNKTLKTAEKLKRIESFSYLPFEGDVDLMNPMTKLVLLEYYGLKNNEIPDDPYRLFFGRCIAEGPRDIIARYTLKKRSYIGSTSMDATLSFIMTNIAAVKKNSLVMDPFVGTGSILVSAAHQGAYVLGSDIDFQTLHARTKPTRHKQHERLPSESIRANLEQYGLGCRYLDVSVVDISRNFWTDRPFLDAVICDPPYGIRESTSRVGKEFSNSQERELPATVNGVDEEADKQEKTPVEVQNNVNIERKDNTNEDGSQGPHYPSKTQYNLYEVFRDLLNFAAKVLVLGGRLVYWLPVMRDEYSSSMVPTHPCLDLIYNCEQVLNSHTSRRLLTMVKIKEPTSSDDAVVAMSDLQVEFREKFFIASQMTREERMARKSLYPRDKRGQGLDHRVTDKEAAYQNTQPDGSLNGYSHNNEEIK